MVKTSSSRTSNTTSNKTFSFFGCAAKRNFVALVVFCLLSSAVYLAFYGEDRPACWTLLRADNDDDDDDDGWNNVDAGPSLFEDLLDDGWPDPQNTSVGEVIVGGDHIEDAADEPPPLIGSRPLVLLSINYHASPVYDLMNLLRPLGVKFIEKGRDPYMCRHFNTCSRDPPLEIIDNAAIHWHMDCSWPQRLYETYNNDPEWQSVDAFICFHPAATCELFIPFGKPIIILATIRIDNGRTLWYRRARWLRAFRRIAADRRNVVAANNRFDVAYTRYFTGVRSLLLPSYCGYPRRTYNPTRPGFLVAVRRHEPFTRWFMADFRSARDRLNLTGSPALTPVRELYPTYDWTDLAAHRGIVNLPMQPSTMAIFEQYRMNVPQFFPSRRLLADWQLRHNVMNEINLVSFQAGFLRPDASQSDVPHPYGATRRSVEHWTALCDWYAVLPHVVYFDSAEHLVRLLHELTDDDLRRISEAMHDYNRRFKGQLLRRWRRVLRHVASFSDNNPH